MFLASWKYCINWIIWVVRAQEQWYEISVAILYWVKMLYTEYSSAVVQHCWQSFQIIRFWVKELEDTCENECNPKAITIVIVHFEVFRKNSVNLLCDAIVKSRKIYKFLVHCEIWKFESKIGKISIIFFMCDVLTLRNKAYGCASKNFFLWRFLIEKLWEIQEVIETFSDITEHNFIKNPFSEKNYFSTCFCCFVKFLCFNSSLLKIGILPSHLVATCYIIRSSKRMDRTYVNILFLENWISTIFHKFAFSRFYSNFFRDFAPNARVGILQI